MNIPIAGIVFAIFFVFLKMQRPPPPRSLRSLAGRLDIMCVPISGSVLTLFLTLVFRGNLLVIGSSCSCAIALTWAGVQFAWSSSQVLAPLIIGLVGFCCWIAYESRVPKYPAVSPHNSFTPRLSLICSLEGATQCPVEPYEHEWVSTCSCSLIRPSS